MYNIIFCVSSLICCFVFECVASDKKNVNLKCPQLRKLVPHCLCELVLVEACVGKKTHDLNENDRNI